MLRELALAVAVILLGAAPAWAGSLQIFEGSLGDPGVTAQFPPGTGLVADIFLDGSSAEGGYLRFGASEIRIVPLGDAVLTAFHCELPGCVEGADYLFSAGGAGTGSIVLSDSDTHRVTGSIELGQIQWNSASSGSLHLAGCNYTDASGVERTCDPFMLAKTLPEPHALLAGSIAVAALARRRRRHRSRSASLPWRADDQRNPPQ